MKRGFLKTSKAQARPLGPVPAPQPAPNEPLTYGRFPIGKVQVDVPKEFKEKMKFVESDPYGGSAPGASWTFTTLPIGAEEDEPVTECFFYPGSKEVLMNLRGFPQPVIRPTRTTFRMAATPGKGVGLFATRKLKAGELILAERPLFVGANGVPTMVHTSFTRAQQLQHSLNTLEEHVQVSVNRMRPDAKAAYMALANSHKEDGSGPIVGIMRTNSVGLDGLRPGVTDATKTYGAVLKDISRLNHSCSPNTSAHFDMLSFSFQLYAVRDVAKGEELTYTYTPVLKSAAERNKELKPYAFVCACAACADVAASDARRAVLRDFSPVVTDWAVDPKLADDWFLNECRKHLDLITLEGVEPDPVYFDVVKALMEAHICLGDAQGASEWAAKLVTFMWDDRRGDLEVKALLDPSSSAYQAHKMWRMRFDDSKYKKDLKQGKDMLASLAALAVQSGGKTWGTVGSGVWGMVLPGPPMK